MKNMYFSLLLVVASVTGGENVVAHNEIGTTQETNLTRNINRSFTEDGSKDNELKNKGREKSKVEATDKSVREYKNVSLKMVARKLRDIEHWPGGMECVSCYGSGITTSDENCYRGAPIKKQKCADVEQCYTELHPNYIKRGCMLPLSINLTFVCKCPLCNDKPSEDLTYYEYTTIRDWEYDNKRLQDPVGIELLCKTCETKGLNSATDKICKLGRNADYIQCTKNQLCFTNIDRQIDFVSRGCINKPVFNALNYFCNESLCNVKPYPVIRKKRSKINFRTIPLSKPSSFVGPISMNTMVFIVAIFLTCANLHKFIL